MFSMVTKRELSINPKSCKKTTQQIVTPDEKQAIHKNELK